MGFSSDSENMEFCHPYFVRDDESLMSKIRRKHPNYSFPTSILSQNVRTGDPVSLNGSRENSSINASARYAYRSDFNQLAEVVRQLKLRQEATNQQFTLLRQENQFLHRQINSLRTQIERQGNLIQTVRLFIQSYRSVRSSCSMFFLRSLWIQEVIRYVCVLRNASWLLPVLRFQVKLNTILIQRR